MMSAAERRRTAGLLAITSPYTAADWHAALLVLGTHDRDLLPSLRSLVEVGMAAPEACAWHLVSALAGEVEPLLPVGGLAWDLLRLRLAWIDLLAVARRSLRLDDLVAWVNGRRPRH